MNIPPPSDLPDHPFLDRWHHGRGRFRSPPGVARRDRRKGGEMFAFLAQLALTGNRAFRYPPGHCREPVVARAELAQPGPSLTWLGQSCFVIRSGGVVVMTDPFLSARASPLPRNGPKRLVPLPLAIAELPVPDVVVVSHNHYDHMDLRALKTLVQCGARLAVTPLGNGDLLRSVGFAQVIEMDWYQRLALSDMSFDCLPAYHFSGRGVRDGNRALWASFGMRLANQSFFFAGDTAYGREFERMASYSGRYETALVPIGAYGPRHLMGGVHADPEEAIAMACDLGARRAVGMHWGTIRLTTEPMWEPAERFLAGEQPIDRVVFAVGETRPWPTP